MFPDTNVKVLPLKIVPFTLKKQWSKFEKMGLFLVKKVNIEKSAKKSPIHSILTHANNEELSKNSKKFSRFLILIRTIRKTTWEVDFRDSIFLDRRFSQTVALKDFCKVWTKFNFIFNFFPKDSWVFITFYSRCLAVCKK